MEHKQRIKISNSKRSTNARRNNRDDDNAIFPNIRMKKLVLFLICMFSLCAYAQETKNTETSPTDEEEIVFMVVEVMPEFPGGQNALFKFLSENVKYPVIAQENGIQGRVIVQFVVDKDGSIVDVEVAKSGGDASLDKEAVRVIKAMPKWKPGKQRGKPVRVKYTVPVNFRLTDGNSTPQQSMPTSNTSINVQVGDTVYPNRLYIETFYGYCSDTITFTQAPTKTTLLSAGIDIKASAIGYYVLTDKFANDVYAFTHYIKDDVVERGHCKFASSGNMQYLDTLYCYNEGKLTKALIYNSADNARYTTKSVILKALLYDEQEKLMREYRLESNQTPQNKPIASWKEYYEDGCYAISTRLSDKIQTTFYSPLGKKISVKLPKLNAAKKKIQKHLQDSVTALYTWYDLSIKVEICFFVDERGNVLMAHCGHLRGEFPLYVARNKGQNILQQIKSEADEILKHTSLNLAPGTINKTPQRMFCTTTITLHNNSKMMEQNMKDTSAPTPTIQAIPSKVNEGDTLWFKSAGIDKVIYKGDTILYSPKYHVTNHSSVSKFYAIVHESKDSIVEWHIHDLAGNKMAVLRHADHSTSAIYVGAKDYYRDNRLLCSEFQNTSDNSCRIVWYNRQEQKEKEYLLTENNIVRQCNLYKEDGRLSRVLFYYPDYVLDYGFEHSDNGETHLIKPDKKDIPWQVGDTVSLKLLNPTYEAGNDVKQRYFMYRDEYLIDNKQDNVDVYGIVEAVANDTLWGSGYERSTGVKTCRLCYCIRTNGTYVHTGLQIFYDNKGLPMSGVTYQHGIPSRSHWYKSDGTEYLNFDLELSNQKTLVPLQMTWVSEQSFTLPTVKNTSSLIKTLNKSLDLKGFEPYYGKVIALLIVGSDGSKQLLVNKANLEPKKETLAKQMAAKEIEDCLGNILASWDIAPAQAGNDDVSMPMVLVFDFKNSSGFVSVQSAHQGAKY